MLGQMNRRFFVKLSAISLTAVPLGNLLVSHSLRAAALRTAPDEIPLVDVSDPQAKALHYVEDAALSKLRKSDSQVCQNCLLFSGQAGAEWGPCAIFSYRQNDKRQNLVVSASGWCSSWGAKAT